MESRTSNIENKLHVGYENWKKIDNCTFDDSCKPKGVCHSNRTKTNATWTEITQI